MHLKLQRSFAVRARNFQLPTVRHNFADTHLRFLAGLRSGTFCSDTLQWGVYMQSSQHHSCDISRPHDQVRISRLNLQLLNSYQRPSLSRIGRPCERHILSHASRIRKVNHAKLRERNFRPYRVLQPLRYPPPPHPPPPPPPPKKKKKKKQPNPRKKTFPPFPSPPAPALPAPA